MPNRNATGGTGVERRHLLPALGLLLVWILAWYFGGSGADRAMLIAGYIGERPWVDIALFVTRLGDWEALVALTLFGAGLLMLRRRWRLAGLLVGSTLLARLLVALQKSVLGVIRPAENAHLVEVQSLSFPSGHAANSMVVYLTLALILTRGGGARGLAIAAAVLLSLLIGATRVLLGVHWPSDVVGGWAFGLLWVLLVWCVWQRRAPENG
jgi:undecaprenyl-diphosphatase